MHLFPRLLGIVCFLPLLNGGTVAQTITLDEGEFRLTVAGREVGSETFTIRQNGTGMNAIIIAQGRVNAAPTEGAQELSASLEVAGATLRPIAYQVAVQGAQQERIAGRVVGGRFSARIFSPAGEMMREYLASEGAVLLDEGVAHHYYFLARRLADGRVRVPLIVPRQSRQVTASVTEQGSETVTVAGQRVEGRRLVVQIEGSAERHVWVDAQGRVLRLEIPARNYSAERKALPG
ncbi:MAG: hypothetical protein HY561_11030 [Gemmatimonadetes bacterium]|nr:hypothetical protein [Gemmatimonadota bacterium]